MTITDNDTSTIEHLDFDYAPPCEWALEKVQCDCEAEWIIVLGCCGKSVLRCEEHFLKFMAMFNSQELSQYRLAHNPDYGGCGHILTIVSYDRLQSKSKA